MPATEMKRSEIEVGAYLMDGKECVISLISSRRLFY